MSKSLNELMQEHVQMVFEKLRPYFGLDDEWQVTIASGECKEEDGTPYSAGCEAETEYSKATIKIDFDRLKTGDDVEEFICHETVHIPMMWLHKTADDMAGLAANLLAETHQANATAEYLHEQVRMAAEKSTTKLGHTVLRMYRRIQELEQRLTELGYDV